MAWMKSTVALKQVCDKFAISGKRATAICRIESENGVSDLHFSVVNLSPAINGEYHLYLIDSLSELFSFKLPAKPTSTNYPLLKCPNLERGFAVGLYYVKDCLPTVVLFAKTENCTVDLQTLNKRVSEKCLNLLKKIQTTSKEEIDKQANLSTSDEKGETPLQKQYDDEAVATENYFLIDDKINIKLDKIKEFDRERISDENELSDSSNKTEKEVNQTDANLLSDETASCSCQSQQTDYYLTVKDGLERIFASFTSETPLRNLFPDSRWARITYSKDKYYVVGVIKEMGSEKYICYGIPDKYSKTPPKELDGYCVFVPLSKDERQGDGYWMMFQDAKTGNCIT